MTKQQSKDPKKDDNKKINTDLDDLLEKAKEESDSKENEDEKTISRDEELEQYKDQALRAIAELQNVKRRFEKDKQDFIKYSSCKLISLILPILDNFDRAFTALPQDLQGNEWVNGIIQIEKSLMSILKNEGLEVISPKKDEDFDANYHECIMQDQNQKQGGIGNCFEKGYRIKDKVLRPAKVSVGNK